jgi:hypothetical protein
MASRIFKILFWVHQVLFGLPSLLIGGDFINIIVKSPDRPLIAINGYYALIPVLLAWIGGTLLWGLASLMHRPLSQSSTTSN